MTKLITLDALDKSLATVKKYVDDNRVTDANEISIQDTAGNFTATNVEEALAELFQFVSNGKTLIASAITDKGVTTSNTDTFQQLAKNIKAIQSTNLNNAIVIIDGKKYKLSEDSNGDITATIINFSINNALTNCSNNNSSTSIAYGASYSAKITANSNYELSNVTVIMGGIDVTSSVYSGGTISISSVEGDIAIIANAIATETSSIEERIMSLMYPMPQRHDFIPHGAPAEWKAESKMYNDTKPTGWSAINAKLQVYRVEGSNYTVNTGVEIKDFNVYGWKNNGWHLVKEISIPQGKFYATDLADNANTNFSQSVRINSNSITIKLTSDMLINTSNGVRDACYRSETGPVNYDSNFEYVFISAKMRKVKWNDIGIDDIDNSKYCANCSGRWVESISSPYYASIAQSKFTEITTSWKLFAMTTVPENWDKGFPVTTL